MWSCGGGEGGTFELAVLELIAKRREDDGSGSVGEAREGGDSVGRVALANSLGHNLPILCALFWDIFTVIFVDHLALIPYLECLLVTFTDFGGIDHLDFPESPLEVLPEIRVNIVVPNREFQ